MSSENNTPVSSPRSHRSRSRSPVQAYSNSNNSSPARSRSRSPARSASPLRMPAVWTPSDLVRYRRMIEIHVYRMLQLQRDFDEQEDQESWEHTVYASFVIPVGPHFYIQGTAENNGSLALYHKRDSRHVSGWSRVMFRDYTTITEAINTFVNRKFN